MKKTTKILLVLAAVVAMTIGAVSTVMAADDAYPTIGEWIAVDEAKNIWKANDVDGEPIVRGWATKDGFWYFFDSSLMLVNTFVTWNEEVYYLDGKGHMAIGWIGFDNDKANTTYDTEISTVDKHEKEKFPSISAIGLNFNGVFYIEDEDAVGNPLDLPKGDKDVLWCFFKEDGTLAQHEWYKAWDLWYFSYGAFAVLGDYQVAIELNNSTQTDNNKFLVEDGEGYYGFAADGHMLVGWEEYIVTAGTVTNGKLTDDDTPYEDKGADKDGRTSTSYWTYYHTDGRQVNTTKADPKDPTVNVGPYNYDIYEGWEYIGENWCYFIQDFSVDMDNTLGMILLQNDFVYDDYTDDDGKLEPNGKKGTFYVDANGFLVRGLKTFAKNTVIGTWEELIVTEGSIKFAAAEASFLFGQESGNMLYGIQDKFYFLTRTDEADYVYEVIQDTKDANCNVPATGKVTINQSTFDKYIKGVTGTDCDYIEGQRLDGKNFFVVIDEAVLQTKWNSDNDMTDTFIYYFESGRMQKNQAITFGEVTIVIDANGCVVTSATDNKVTVAGHQFVLEPGVDANSIVLGGNYVIPGIKK